MKFIYLYLIIAAFIMVTASSCKKELTGVNTNPDAIPAAQYNPNLLLTTVQLMYTGSTSFGGSAWATKWGGVACFIQHTASTNPGFYYGDKYLNNIGAMGEMFQDSYTSEVQPAVELYQLTANKPQYRNLHQMARIMKAMVFEQITDLYGDIPYFQAGLGYYARIYQPVYDKQQVIYTDMLKEVSQAVDSLDEKADKPTGDVLYLSAADQIGEWKKFGNSLLVRMAMRLTKVDPTTAQAYVTKAATNTFKSNADNAIVQHQDGNQLTQNRDALEIFGNDSTDLKLSSAFISNMKNNSDPRLPVVAWIYSQDSNGNSTGDNTPADQIGMPPGFIVGGNNPSTDITKLDSIPSTGIAGYSRLNDNILYTAAPNLILTYAETELLLADAAKRWGIAGSAATHYKNGVLAAVTQLSAYGGTAAISDADAATYYSGVAYNDAIGLDQINTQYWLCTLMDEYETWSNWRRTGYPNLTPVNYPGNITNGTIPRRLTYPPSQKITNLPNYNAEVAGLTGGDKMTTRVWWDK
ncbi:SusD/RagB family nutrient-binding outer membrane lipoprotein [Mucilaginibacter sp.]|uniref:SusD/RagB family nutrient-binding outer membrane lipoprotein n=1 Tax=Mucilaginibacter sp. TaxID=1882438 RepID=UPI002844BDBD|nr:SusD/RagB family nutrient-binding outer membrane lipoprotein [Mucilaginibacter sp.]MDR3697392.1 SusD/RagB family nutrient-binding outer membrane lipoprotein [Mucilaginibacter sp.]